MCAPFMGAWRSGGFEGSLLIELELSLYYLTSSTIYYHIDFPLF
jgi:hypothetical protein